MLKVVVRLWDCQVNIVYVLQSRGSAMFYRRIFQFLLAAVIITSTHGSPMKEALDSVHCVLRGYNFKVKVAGCQPRIVAINTCMGTCLSFSTPSGQDYKQVPSCTCCRDIGQKKVDVGLWCEDPNNSANLVQKFHTIMTATDCACAKC